MSTVIFDPTGYPLWLNPAFERMWGAGMREVPPGYSVLTDPQLVAAGVAPLIARSFAGEAVLLPPIRYDIAETAGRGNVRWTQGHFHPIRDPSGAVTHVVLMHLEVTEQMEAARILGDSEYRARRSEARYKALVEAVATAVWHTDAEGRFNDDLGSWQSLTGQPPEESRDDGWLEAIHPDDREDARAKWRRSLASASVYEHEQRLRLGDGGYRWFVARSAPVIDEQGATREWIGAHVDIEARKQAEAQRLRLLEAERHARQRAEEANRAKSQFLAMMSHELRTPLNAIGGYAELLELGVRGPVAPEQAEDLRRIRRNQRHLLAIINDILEYARVEAGRIDLQLRDVALLDIVASAEAMIAPQLLAKQLRFEIGQCDPALRARADPEKVAQIMGNLLGNAAKFTPAGGAISLECRGDRDVVAIVVRDSGPGIPDAMLERVFEPFFQLDNSLTRTTEGVGLGLAISRDLAQAMAGDVRAESTPGVGSAFTLVLPQAKAARAIGD